MSARPTPGPCAAPAIPPIGPSVVIAKWDRLHGDFLRDLVIGLWPAADVAVFQSGGEALAGLRRRPAQLGIFGLTFPDADGLDLLAIIAAEKLVDRLVVLSGRRDERARQALRFAVFAGYFDTESEGVGELAAAVARVAAGQRYISPSLGRPLSTAEKSGRALARLLSPTELRVLAVIGDGCDDQEAAGRLGVRPGTVQSHRQHIMRKLGVQTRTALMRAAIDRGIIRIARGRIFRPGFEQELNGLTPHRADRL